MGNPGPNPNRVGPSQPPLNFVDGSGYILLRGVVEAWDCEVGWWKVMKAWANGNEKVVAKNLELLFNAGRSEKQTRDPECKMSESTGQWKQRVLFSYYNHPLCSHGRLVSRALSLLLREAKRLIPSTAILTTQCLTRFTRRWNTWFASHTEPRAFPDLTLFELDVCEMFPSLDREATVQAIRDLHEAVVKARNARGLSLRFAINKQDIQLDRIGTGYSRYFHNL